MTGLIAVHLWQSTLVVFAGWLLALACRRNAAEIRFVIWCGASLKFLVPLAALQWLGDRFGQSLPQPPALGRLWVDTASAILTPTLPQQLQLSDDLSTPLATLAALIWACGVLLLGWRWFDQYRAVSAVLAASRPMPMDLPVAVYVTHSNIALGVLGILRPVVIVPERVVLELSSPQLAAVLAHELCHIRRSDNLLAAIHRCVETLFWFHPLAWWVGERLLDEREAACDEAVIDAGHAQQVYAESILKVCRLSTVARGTVAATAGPLVQRISSIMGAQPSAPLDLGRCTLLLSAVSVVWFAPIFTGIIDGAQRADADSQPITFDAITLQPAAPARQRSARVDPATNRVTLKNVSVRSLILSAYPRALIRGDAYVIEDIRYDIEAHWHSQGTVSERALYRHLLRRVLQGHTNVQLFVDQRCEVACR